MYPYIRIGAFSTPTYGLCVFLGIVACIVYTLIVLIKVEKQDKSVIMKTLAVFAPALIALGLFALFFNSLFHSIEKQRLTIGGITWEGGFIGCAVAYVLVAHFFIREKRGDCLHQFSLIMPGLVLGHGIGRVGCFFGGCCYGVITDGPLGVVFPDGSPADLQYPNAVVGSLPVLPTQLFEAAFEVLLFVAMVLSYKKSKNYGLIIYCLAYGLFRFILEFWRGDDRGASGIYISPSQMMSIIIIAAGVLLILYERGIIFKKLAAKAENWRKQNAPEDPDAPQEEITSDNISADTPPAVTPSEASPSEASPSETPPVDEHADVTSAT